MKLAVIGIGQSIRGDDAAGIVAAQRWREMYPATAKIPGVIVEFFELPGFELLEFLGNVEAAVLVDAVLSSAPAGSIHQLDQEGIVAFDKAAGFAHGWGVAETLALARKLNLPASHTIIRLVGIEAAQIGLGSGLSHDVEQAIPAACETIQAEVLHFLH